MESSADRWTSKYFPLAADGPLPPGITASMLKNAYRAIGISPQALLKMGDVHGASLDASQLLRKRADDPDFRARLASRKAPNGMSYSILEILFVHAISNPKGLEFAAALYLASVLGNEEIRQGLQAAMAEGKTTFPITRGEYSRLVRAPASHKTRRGEAGRKIYFGDPATDSEESLHIPDFLADSHDTAPKSRRAPQHRVTPGGPLGVGESLAILWIYLKYKGLDPFAEFIGHFLVFDDGLYAFLGLDKNPEAAQVTEEAAHVTEEAAQETEEAAHVTEEAAHLTEEAAQETEEAAHVTEEAAQVTKEAAHVTEEAAHLTEEAAHVTEEVAQVTTVLDHNPAEGCRPTSESETRPATPTPGPRSEDWTAASRALIDARDLRQRLGGAELLDRTAFGLALDAEERARGELRALEDRLLYDLETTLAHQRSKTRSWLPPLKLEPPTDMRPPSLARWLDETVPGIETLEQLTARLQDRVQRLMDLEPEAASIPAPRAPVGLQEALEQAEALAPVFEGALERAEAWQERLAAIQDDLADCADPRPSTALTRLTRDTVTALLRRAHVERRFRPLTPLLLRALGDLEAWDSAEVSPEALEIVRDICSDALTGARGEDARDLLAYLPETMLQALLRCEDVQIGRLAIAAAFRDSILRQHPLFFVSVWPGVKARARAACMRERLATFFDALQRIYLRDGTVESVVKALGQAGLERRGQAGARGAARSAESADPLIGSLAVALQRLRRNTDGALGEWRDKGGLETEEYGNRWLEARVLSTLNGLERPEVPAAFLGELAEVSTLFSRKSPSRAAGTSETAPSPEVASGAIVASARAMRQAFRRVRGLGRGRAAEGWETGAGLEPRVVWPAWLEASPASERLWMCRVDGQATWRDVLQEGIARVVLERRRTPAQILESYLMAHAFEALFEAGLEPEFQADRAAQAVVAGANRLRTRLEKARRRIDAMSLRVGAQPRLQRVEAGGAVLRDLEAPLLEAMEALDRQDLDLAEQRLAEVGLVLVGGSLSLLCSTAWRDGSAPRAVVRGYAPSTRDHRRIRRVG